MAYKYQPPKDGVTIDYAWHNYLTQNFHPIVARVAFINYVFEGNNMTGDAKSAYIRDDLIVHEAESTEAEWISRRFGKPMDAWNKLIELTTGMWMSASEIYIYLKDVVRFVLWHSESEVFSQSGHDLNRRDSVLTQIADFEDKIDQMFNNLQLNPNDQFLQDHAAVLHTLLGPGSQVLEDLTGFLGGIRHQEQDYQNEYPEAKNKFEVDHFLLDPFEQRHNPVSRSIDDLREKFIDWPRNKNQSGFVDLHFVLFLYDINKCFSDAVQWNDLDKAQSAYDLRLKLTKAFADADVNQILNGQHGYDYRVVDEKVFEWMKHLESMLPSGGGIGERSFRKKRKRFDTEHEDIQSGLRFPEPIVPLTEEEELFNRPQRRPRLEDSGTEFLEGPDPSSRNWIIPVIAFLGLSTAAYATWRGIKAKA